MTDPIMTTIEITVSRVITSDGQMAIKVRTPEHFSHVEALGMMEAAKWTIWRDMDGQR